jgi:hypothetical protein
MMTMIATSIITTAGYMVDWHCVNDLTWNGIKISLMILFLAMARKYNERNR